MKISALKPTTVRLPIEAPVRHSYGGHSAFVRTLLEVHTDEGIMGLSETVPTADGAFREAEELIAGEDPFDLERIQMKIVNAGYMSTQAPIAAAVEIGCLDIQGKALGLPVHKLLGGPLREEVPVAAYLFFRYPGPQGEPPIDSAESLVAHAADLAGAHGFTTFKLKGGVFEPEIEIETMKGLRDHFGPTARLRLDPNACWTTETAIRMAKKAEPLDLEYLEDPAWGIAGMGRVHDRTSIPLATNMCVTWFDDLAPAVEGKAVDVILSDAWYWAGLRNCRQLGRLCHTLGLGMGMHSGLEGGVGLAAMLHCAVTIPNLRAAIDAHYHHLTDDIIVGGPIPYHNGAMRPPDGAGLGVELDADKVDQYAEAYQRWALRSARQSPDPIRPDWFPEYPRW